jgi:hypothetical protein
MPNEPASLLTLPTRTLRVELGHFALSAYRNISIAVWVGQATRQAVEALLEAQKKLIDAHPNGHSAVTFILDGLPAPTPDAHALITKVFAARNQLACLAIILEGSGFWASGLRSMLNNSHRQAGGPAALQVATSLESVVTWFSEEHKKRTGVELLPMPLLNTLTNARQEGERLAKGELRVM